MKNIKIDIVNKLYRDIIYLLANHNKVVNLFNKDSSNLEDYKITATTITHKYTTYKYFFDNTDFLMTLGHTNNNKALIEYLQTHDKLYELLYQFNYNIIHFNEDETVHSRSESGINRIHNDLLEETYFIQFEHKESKEIIRVYNKRRIKNLKEFDKELVGYNFYNVKENIDHIIMEEMYMRDIEITKLFENE